LNRAQLPLELQEVPEQRSPALIADNALTGPKRSATSIRLSMASVVSRLDWPWMGNHTSQFGLMGVTASLERRIGEHSVALASLIWCAMSSR
jgi:hypothetical protein